MLKTLQVENFGLIQHLDLDWGPGFTVITGESGSGKSQILEAILAGLGLRWESQWLGRFGSRCRIAQAWAVPPDHPAWLALDEAGIAVDPGEELVVTRDVVQDRSGFRIQGQPVPGRVARQVGETLVEYAGQHAATRLNAAAVLDWLDRAAGLLTLRQAVEDAWRAWQAQERALRTWAEGLPDPAERARREEALAELETLAPKPGEDAAIAAQLDRLRHGQRLAEGYARIRAGLEGDGEGGVEALLAAIGRELSAMAQLDPRLHPQAEQWEAARQLVREVSWELARWQADLEWEPDRAERLAARLDQLARAKRRFGPDLDAVIATWERLAQEVAAWRDQAGEEARLSAKVAAEQAKWQAAAEALSQARRRACEGVVRDLVAVLEGMEMPGAAFALEFFPDAPSPQGMDRVVATFSPAPGQVQKPLHKVASGGEMARVALAMTLSLREGRAATFLFDEADSGLGGVAAARVGRLLRQFAERHQVVLVTHQPAIAALAEHHLWVEKVVSAEGSLTRARWVAGAERTREVARMLSGSQDPVALEHAAALLDEGAAGGQRVG
ncbi:MAG: AAA family ATPase [Firmicutes bacterium]|nr:AAA family ATPase [Alicyclobacillaceae bacterium]MCL6496685.1 AAA family ATPase [Bacillota bacterium]